MSDKVQYSCVVSTKDLFPDFEWHVMEFNVEPGPFPVGDPDLKIACVYQVVVERHSGAIPFIVHAPALALLLLNLFAFFTGYGTYKRFIIFAVNINVHVIVMVHLSWKAPVNGNNVPNVGKVDFESRCFSSLSFISFSFTVKYFRNSLLITTCAILESILLSSLSQSSVIVPGNVRKFSDWMATKGVQRILFTDVPDPSTDDTQLVNNQIEVNRGFWTNFCLMIDRLLLVFVLFVYSIMYLSLFP